MKNNERKFYMKKIICITIVMLISLVACTRISATPSNETTTGNSSGTEGLSYSSYITTQTTTESIKERGDLIYKNLYEPIIYPLQKEIYIDIAFQKKWEETVSGQGLQDQINIYSEFTEIWKTEMNNAFAKLKKQLSEEQLEKLNESQEAWVTYIQNSAELLLDVEYEAAERTDERIGMYALHEDALIKMRMYRDRTMQLINYCYITSGEYSYVFKGE